jgi:hypothetical protein
MSCYRPSRRSHGLSFRRASDFAGLGSFARSSGIPAQLMIASFFRRLESHEVDYLLISGQATILYGAATFSEDVDLWLMPSQPNIERFVGVLRASNAHYYKLTPPLVLENLERGHGFHFVLPGEINAPEVYLDVMGRPPRVRSFEDALAGARFFDTDFGRVHTVGIKELVEIKKTQRPEDYPIIGRLAIGYLREAAQPLAEADFRWALENVFSLPELRTLLSQHMEAYQKFAVSMEDPFMRALANITRGETLPASLEDELDAQLEARSSALRRADRRYWRDIIDELRRLRRQSLLMPEGAQV